MKVSKILDVQRLKEIFDLKKNILFQKKLEWTAKVDSKN